MAIAGAIAWSRSRVLGYSLFPLVSTNAERELPGNNPSSPSEAGAQCYLQNPALVVLTWGSWDVGLSLPLP